MVGKLNLPVKCFDCFNGHDCGGNGVDKLNQEEIENLSQMLGILKFDHFMYPCECNAFDIYKEYGKYLPILPLLKKYDVKIKELIAWQEETFNVEEFLIDIHNDSIELFWQWEDYNGLYCTSGSMKALYHHEDGDETWCKEETKSLIKYFKLDYESINSFEDFIEQMDMKTVSY